VRTGFYPLTTARKGCAGSRHSIQPAGRRGSLLRHRLFGCGSFFALTPPKSSLVASRIGCRKFLYWNDRLAIRVAAILLHSKCLAGPTGGSSEAQATGVPRRGCFVFL